MKHCPQCNQTYEDAANFCLIDATPLKSIAPSDKQCPKCRKTYPSDAAFCMTDGTALVAQAGSAESVAAAPPAKLDAAQPVPKTKRTAVAKAKKPRKKRSPRTLDPKAKFSAGMTQWLNRSGYSVGLSLSEVDTEGDLAFAEGVAGVIKQFFDSSMWLTSGSGSEELFQALTPYIPLADLLGSKLELQTVTLIPVIYADALNHQAIEERLDEYIEIAGPLTEFGPRLNFQSQGVAQISPLLVYFDREKFAAHAPELLPDLWQKRIMRRIYLRGGMVNVPEQSVTWAERRGFFSLGDKIADWVGTKATIFDDADVAAVMHLAEQSAAAKKQ